MSHAVSEQTRSEKFAAAAAAGSLIRGRRARNLIGILGTSGRGRGRGIPAHARARAAHTRDRNSLTALEAARLLQQKLALGAAGSAFNMTRLRLAAATSSINRGLD